MTLQMSSTINLSHNSLWLAYQPLNSLLKLFGVCPFKLSGPKCCCIFSAVINVLLAVSTLVISVKYDFLDVEITIDETTTIIIIWAVAAGALLTIALAPFKGQAVSTLFHKWRRMDKRLNLNVDEQSKVWGSRLILIFVLLALLFVGSSTTIVFSQRSSNDPLTKLILSVEALLLVWNYSAILMVQICIYFFCLALRFRFDQLKLNVEQLLTVKSGIKTFHVFTLSNEDDREDIANDLEELRHTYHMLSEMSGDVSNLFSPHILLYFLLDSIILCTSMYRVIKVADFTMWYIPLEIITMATAILKILTINIVGDNIVNAAGQSLQVLPKTSYKYKSKGSRYQAQLWTLTSGQEAGGPAVTATGFFNLDRRMFTATLGSVATYFVVLLQFQQ